MPKPTVQGLVNVTTSIAISLGIMTWGVRSEDDVIGQTGFVLLMFSAAVGCGYLVKGFSVSGITIGVFLVLMLWMVLGVLMPAS